MLLLIVSKHSLSCVLSSFDNIFRLLEDLQIEFLVLPVDIFNGLVGLLEMQLISEKYHMVNTSFHVDDELIFFGLWVSRLYP